MGSENFDKIELTTAQWETIQDKLETIMTDLAIIKSSLQDNNGKKGVISKVEILWDEFQVRQGKRSSLLNVRDLLFFLGGSSILFVAIKVVELIAK